jgi:hypothetical protein
MVLAGARAPSAADELGQDGASVGDARWRLSRRGLRLPPRRARAHLPDLFTPVHLFLESGGIMPAMPTKKKARRTVSPIVATVVRPVSTRLSRMEALLIEMRAEQDVKLRKINKLQQQIEELTTTVKRRLTLTRMIQDH